MLALERQWKKQRGSEFFTSFMVRRIFRIYPLSVAIVLLIVPFHLPQAELNN
jgi:peptidoglycan/LPS O-acetylase OafA/YrhL